MRTTSEKGTIWSTGRHALKPKELGGLGIKDIEKFSRTLRLGWLWHN
jgi:hypothetical protein